MDVENAIISKIKELVRIMQVHLFENIYNILRRYSVTKQTGERISAEFVIFSSTTSV